MNKKRLLILCTGNSARSQMAEGLVNHFLAESWQAESAGTNPTGSVHPLAIVVMAELGIDLNLHRSKSTEEFGGHNFDFVITVCDQAAENCPVWLGAGKRVHIPFADPAQARGNEAECLAAFRQIRDEIREHLFGYLAVL